MPDVLKEGTPARPDEKKQALSELRRGQILKAALHVFARDGFASSHVEDIAREAGLAKGTVYLYFESKQDLYRAVIMEQFCSLNGQTCDALQKGKSIEIKVRQYIQTRLRYCDSQRDFLRVMLAEVGSVAGQPVMTRAELQELCTHPVRELARHLEQAVANGEVRDVEAQALAWMIADLVRGASERRVMGQSTDSAELTADRLMQTLMHGLRPDPPAMDQAAPADASTTPSPKTAPGNRSPRKRKVSH